MTSDTILLYTMSLKEAIPLQCIINTNVAEKSPDRRDTIGKDASLASFTDVHLVIGYLSLIITN